MILELKFKSNSKSKKYKIKAISNNVVHIRKSANHLAGLHYLMS